MRTEASVCPVLQLLKKYGERVRVDILVRLPGLASMDAGYVACDWLLRNLNLSPRTCLRRTSCQRHLGLCVRASPLTTQKQRWVLLLC